MKIFKKFISAILCMAILTAFPLAAHATEVEPIPSAADEYITFTTGKERIASDGTFEFNVRAELRSGTFTADDDTIKIYSKCRLFNVNTGSVTSSKNYEYTLTLYEKGVGAVGSYTGYANNRKTTQKFSVVEGKEYYFIITCDPTHTMPYSLRGTGKVTNVTV